MKKTAAARISLRVAACLAATALPLLAVGAPQNAPSAPKTRSDKSGPTSQSFTETTDVLAVEVPVQVLDKDGEPVRGLKADDFAVFDGRKQQPVTGFEVLYLSVQ